MDIYVDGKPVETHGGGCGGGPVDSITFRDSNGREYRVGIDTTGSMYVSAQRTAISSKGTKIKL